MARGVRVEVESEGAFKGATTNIADYTIQEDSTPLAVSDTSGGVGDISFTLDEDTSPTGSRLLYGATVAIQDGTNGITRGRVNGLSADGSGELVVSASNSLYRLTANATHKPFTGTLEAALLGYMRQVGVVDEVRITASAGRTRVSLPGFDGALWDRLKELAAVYRFEVAFVSNRIIVRDPRLNEVNNNRIISQSWSVDEQQMARKVKVHYYTNTWYERKHLYPTVEESPQVIEIKQGETKVFNLPVSGSIDRVYQPTPQTDPVEPMIDFTNQNSTYSIIDKDDQPVRAGDWSGDGGWVRAAVGQDGVSIDVTVRGMNNVERAPYRLANKRNDEDVYPTLRLVARGVFTTDRTVEIATGIPESITANEYGTEIQNPAIATAADAFEAGLRVANTYAGQKRSLSVTAESVNRTGVDGKARTYSFGDYNQSAPGRTIADFNKTWAGKTFADFNAYFDGIYAQLFENQAFGNVAGSRVRHRENFYRIRNATIAPESVQYSAEADNIIADFNTIWKGKTFADFNEFWAGYTFGEFDMIPLYAPAPADVWVDPAEPTRDWVKWNEGVYGQGPFGGKPGETTPPIDADFGYGDGGYGDGGYGGGEAGAPVETGYGNMPYGDNGYGD